MQDNNKTLKQGPASSAASGEDRGGWERPHEGLLALIAYRLQEIDQRVLGSARLVCRHWAAELLQGCSRLKVKGKGPADWEHRFCGLEDLVWLWPQNAGQFWPAKLRSLRLWRCSDGDLRMLKGLSGLASLDLRGNKDVTDTGLKELGLVSNLTSLNMSQSHRITSMGHISVLASFHQSFYKTTDEAIKELNHLINLTFLDLTYGKVSDEGIKELKHLTNLSFLDLSYCNISDEGLKVLKHMPKLTSLILEGNETITDEGLKELKNSSSLASLNLSDCQGVTDDGLKELGGLSNLTSLNLAQNDISDAGVRHLKHLSNLTSLSIGIGNYVETREPAITDEGLKNLKHMPNLTTLYLEGCMEITDEGLRHLRHMSILTTLNVEDCAVTDMGLIELRRHMSSLTSLNVSGTFGRVTDDALEHISHFSNLTSLGLARCEEITYYGLKKLGNMRSLTSLNLQHIKSLSSLCLKGLGTMTNIASLNLLGCDITDDGLECLTGLYNLTSLDVTYCKKITDKGLEHIMRLHRLTFLGLRYGTSDGTTLAGRKRLMRQLPRLIISYC